MSTSQASPHRQSDGGLGYRVSYQDYNGFRERLPNEPHPPIKTEDFETKDAAELSQEGSTDSWHDSMCDADSSASGQEGRPTQTSTKIHRVTRCLGTRAPLLRAAAERQ